MDKRKVIAAYRKGVISMRECAQLLGIDSLQIMGIVGDLKEIDRRTVRKSSIR